MVEPRAEVIDRASVAEIGNDLLNSGPARLPRLLRFLDCIVQAIRDLRSELLIPAHAETPLLF